MSAARPVRVVRVYSQLEVGGIEWQLLRILPRLQARGRYETTLILTRREGTLAPALREAGVPVELLPLRGGLAWRAVSPLAARLRALRAGIVHAHAYEANTTATAAALFAGNPPVVASLHLTGTIRGPRRRLQDRLLNRLRGAVVCVSESVRRNYLAEVGGAEEKVVVIYNGIDVRAVRETPADPVAVRRELGFPDDALLLVCVARLAPQKAHDVLLEAFARVGAAAPRARLLLVGDGPSRVVLEARCAAADLAGRVRFAGERLDIARLLRSSDVGTLGSDREGFSNVVLESLAAGLPQVVTEVGGNREAMDGHKTGLLVPPRDPAALADAIVHILADEPLRRRLAAAASARAERFDLDRTADDFEALYERLLAPRGRRAR